MKKVSLKRQKRKRTVCGGVGGLACVYGGSDGGRHTRLV